MGFDIMSLQKGRGQVQARSRADEGRAVLKYIDVEDLVPSEDNFYSMSAIDELAGLIELSGGVKQPGLVVPLGGGKYKLLSGHRRRLASLQLVKQGKEAYRKMPCMVEDAGRDVERDAEADELRAIDEAILLITTNGQREKTDWDKVQEATRLRALLEKKRRFEKIPGETRKLIAEQLGTTPAQVGRYDSIEKHLIPAFKNWLEQERIGISVAYELSTLPENVQWKAAEECWGKRRTVTLEDVRRWKEQAEKPAEGERAYKPGAYTREEKTNLAGPVVTKPTESERKETPPVTEQPGGVTMVMADEIGPAPSAEQWEALKERTDAAKAKGKIVDFPAPAYQPSAPSAEEEQTPKKEPMHKRMAANILEDLQMYCEEMLAIEIGLADTWAERADALGVAIAVLRK